MSVSQLIGSLICQPSQSSDSYGRTDGRTDEELPTATLKPDPPYRTRAYRTIMSWRPTAALRASLEQSAAA